MHALALYSYVITHACTVMTCFCSSSLVILSRNCSTFLYRGREPGGGVGGGGAGGLEPPHFLNRGGPSPPKLEGVNGSNLYETMQDVFRTMCV